MDWLQLAMQLDGHDPAVVEAVFERRGALAVTYADAADDPVLEPAPGETPLWKHTEIRALFAAGVDVDALRAALGTALHLDEPPPIRVEKLADRAWEREWLADFRPMRFGRRLWIVPGGEAAPDPEAVSVTLDPGLAFGTGTHETTALCLEWLEAAELRNRTVLDFGCGSGILGIAALKLGAESVDAVDIDLQAVRATRQNAERNGVLDRLRAGTRLDDSGIRYDVVVANILAGTLIETANSICDRLRPGAMLALSGVLGPQVDDVTSAFAGRIDFAPPHLRGDWALLTGTRG